MPGTVVKVMVAAGDAVRKGQPLVLIESMKMQTEIAARRDGTVEQVFVVEQQTFDRGAKLVALRAEG
jgi:biotin carboxyl carrier protein